MDIKARDERVNADSFVCRRSPNSMSISLACEIEQKEILTLQIFEILREGNGGGIFPSCAVGPQSLALSSSVGAVDTH